MLRRRVSDGEVRGLLAQRGKDLLTQMSKGAYGRGSDLLTQMVKGQLR